MQFSDQSNRRCILALMGVRITFGNFRSFNLHLSTHAATLHSCYMEDAFLVLLPDLKKRFRYPNLQGQSDFVKVCVEYAR